MPFPKILLSHIFYTNHFHCALISFSGSKILRSTYDRWISGVAVINAGSVIAAPRSIRTLLHRHPWERHAYIFSVSYSYGLNSSTDKSNLALIGNQSSRRITLNPKAATALEQGQRLTPQPHTAGRRNLMAERAKMLWRAEQNLHPSVWSVNVTY